MAVAPDGETAAIVGGDPDQLTWVSLPSGRIEGTAILPMAPTAVAFSATGNWVVVAFGDCGPGPEPCADASSVDVFSTGASTGVEVTTGAGSAELAAVPGGDDVLVGADGAGTVSEIDAATGKTVQVLDVGTGIISGIAVQSSGLLAAVSNETAGETTLFDLATGANQGAARVTMEPGQPLVAMGQLLVGQVDGENVFALGTVHPSLVGGLSMASGVSAMLYLPALGQLVVACAWLQEVVSAPGLGEPVNRMPIGTLSRGDTSALVSANSGQEALAIAAHGLAVLGGQPLRILQVLKPDALGGAPTSLAAANGSLALVYAGGHVDIVAVRS